MAMPPVQQQLSPTYVGLIESTVDALLMFEACLTGRINHCPRRPHDRERGELIQSGNVFVYEEGASGIKRWTDGLTWSPSRILGNFLIYRELDKPFPPGEKKKARKGSVKKPNNGVNSRTALQSRSNSYVMPTGAGYTEANFQDTVQGNQDDQDKRLIGSLVDSYDFKDEGLVKKTISITVSGITHHLVSYYRVQDAKSGRLRRPRDHPDFRDIIPRPEMLEGQNYRFAIEEGEYLHLSNGGGLVVHPCFHGIGMIYASQRTLSLPNVPIQGFPPPPIPNFDFQQGLHMRPGNGLSDGNYSDMGRIAQTMPPFTAQPMPHGLPSLPATRRHSATPHHLAVSGPGLMSTSSSSLSPLPGMPPLHEHRAENDVLGGGAFSYSADSREPVTVAAQVSLFGQEEPSGLSNLGRSTGDFGEADASEIWNPYQPGHNTHIMDGMQSWPGNFATHNDTSPTTYHQHEQPHLQHSEENDDESQQEMQPDPAVPAIGQGQADYTWVGSFEAQPKF